MSWEYDKGCGRHRICAHSLLIILFSMLTVSKYFFFSFPFFSHVSSVGEKEGT